MEQAQANQGAENVYKFLSERGVLNALVDETTFHAWMSRISFGDFERYLVRLNGIMREIPMKEMRADGQNVALSSEFMGTSYLPPRAEDKSALLRLSFEKAKDLPPRDAGLLIYFALQAVHPFVDGNGRTGRLLFLLLESAANKVPLAKNEILDFLKHDGESGPGRDLFEKKIRPPEQVYRIVGSVLAQSVLGEETLKEVSRLYSGLQSGEIEDFENQQMLPETKKKVMTIMSEAGTGNFAFKDIVLFRFLQQKGKMDEYAVKDEGQKLLRTDGQKILSELSEIEANELVELFAGLKRAFVEKLVDVIANPEEYKFADGRVVKDAIYL